MQEKNQQPQLNLKAIGKHLRQLRHARMQKLEETAANLSMSISKLSRIENGTIKKLPVNELVILANYYKTPISEILAHGNTAQ